MNHRNTIHLAYEYDVKVIIFFLITCFHWLNPIFKNVELMDLMNNLMIKDCWRGVICGVVYGVGWFCVQCCLGKQLPFHRTKFNKELRFDSLTSYFFHCVLLWSSRLLCTIQIVAYIFVSIQNITFGYASSLYISIIFSKFENQFIHNHRRQEKKIEYIIILNWKLQIK
jgi:hypothetical protein